MIDVQEVVKSYGGEPVLRGVSLSVRKGEVAALIGPSGCGKSTLLRCLNGLEPFDAGRVVVADIEIRGGLARRREERTLRALRLKAGMVFQEYHLFPHLTALGNVMEAPVHVLGRTRADVDKEARALLERVGLAGRLHERPERLSGGEKQRLSIARALAMRPEVLLLDEPTSALDPRLAAEVESVLSDLASSGQTMLVATHSMALARRAAHTVHVLGGGRVIEHGPPAQVLDDPQHPATRELLAALPPAG